MFWTGANPTIALSQSLSNTVATSDNSSDNSKVLAQNPQPASKPKSEVLQNAKCVTITSEVRPSSPEASPAPESSPPIKPDGTSNEPSQDNSSQTPINLTPGNNQQQPQPATVLPRPSQNNFPQAPLNPTLENNQQPPQPNEDSSQPSQDNFSQTPLNPTLENNQQQPQPNEDSSQPSRDNSTNQNNQQLPQPGKQFFVKKIDVRGYKIFSEEQIKSITQPLEGKNVTSQELANVADKITELYLKPEVVILRAVILLAEFRVTLPPEKPLELMFPVLMVLELKEIRPPVPVWEDESKIL